MRASASPEPATCGLTPDNNADATRDPDCLGQPSSQARRLGARVEPPVLAREWSRATRKRPLVGKGQG